MKTANGSSFTRRMLNAAAVTLFAGALYACGGGGSSVAAGSGELTQGQFDALLKTSAVYADLSKKVTDDEATIAKDETTIARMAQFGHIPGKTTVDARGVVSYGINKGVATEAVSFGPCPDMGQHIGDFSPSPVSADITYFKQCPINGVQYVYGVMVETGAIRVADKVFYSGTNCNGNIMELESQSIYSRLALQQGIVFRSPADNSLLMVEAGQPGTTMTAHSDSSGVCTTEDTTDIGYTVSANDINVTGVPSSVPANFIY